MRYAIAMFVAAALLAPGVCGAASDGQECECDVAAQGPGGSQTLRDTVRIGCFVDQDACKRACANRFLGKAGGAVLREACRMPSPVFRRAPAPPVPKPPN